ncbi:sulfatase-like hydrolase/transferase [Marinoscillum furvescens]|uniref:Arylsulfatase A-like enzyme n=1 Tax=Marinoscillum furvescens DSM 4134 TaxID=1122208 RepID=A0A3D9L8J8_MARFU|nr:sulfatase-like hydrolase/transferase [Marinoscillum furvescens]REE01996.1 arylsulfatase A-like enzyme [Marinoscillum furvescens DSM 4134]
MIRLKGILFQVVLLAVAMLGTSCQEEARRPNFLFVLVDDQSPYDLQVYNAKSILETPVIDRLAREGMVFESARHMGSMNGAVCTPSRHMIMTGRTLWHLPPSAEFQKQTDFHPLDTMSMPAIFNRAGYSTMRTCKANNSYPGANRQFSIIKDKTKRGGTAETGSAWHAEQVLDYLGQRASAQQKDPFFIYLGFSHPHDPRNGTPELLEKYGATNEVTKDTVPPLHPKQPAIPENYLSAHPFHHGHPNLRDEDRVKGVWKRRDENTIRNELGREFACSENIDIQLGRVLDRLEAMGELDNTYIIYTSDHGMAIGRHGLQGKQNLYEHTWRVPFIVKGPGVQAGKRVAGNIYLLDVLPTLCELAGIRVPETVEGQSFKPVLTGEQQVIRDVQYAVYCGGTKPGMRTVRKGDWKLIKYDVLDGAVQETQLFNLAENPLEYLPEHQKEEELLTDLAENPKYANQLAEMEALLLEQMKLHDDPYRLWNQTQAKN